MRLFFFSLTATIALGVAAHFAANAAVAINAAGALLSPSGGLDFGAAATGAAFLGLRLGFAFALPITAAIGGVAFASRLFPRERSTRVGR